MLGVSRVRFELMLEAMPPVQWPAPNKSAARARSNADRRGVFTDKQRYALAQAKKARRLKNLHQVDDLNGTIRELAQHFGIRHKTVNERMRQGMTLKQALTTPITPHHQRRKGARAANQ